MKIYRIIMDYHKFYTLGTQEQRQSPEEVVIYFSATVKCSRVNFFTRDSRKAAFSREVTTLAPTRILMVRNKTPRYLPYTARKVTGVNCSSREIDVRYTGPLCVRLKFS